MGSPRTCPECDQPLTVEGSMTPEEFRTSGADPVHVFCDLCGGAEHPANLTPDWNGETGCHLSCEAKAEARATRELRIANIVEVIVRTAAKGNEAPHEQLVATILENADATSLTPDMRTWLVLEEDDDDESPYLPDDFDPVDAQRRGF